MAQDRRKHGLSLCFIKKSDCATLCDVLATYNMDVQMHRSLFLDPNTFTQRVQHFPSPRGISPITSLSFNLPSLTSSSC
jgi:hypothetical protein